MCRQPPIIGDISEQDGRQQKRPPLGVGPKGAGMPSYGQYIRSKEWKAKRDAILRRANNRCEACRKRKATQVHHLTYERLFNEKHTDLLAVCARCHAKEHPDKDFGRLRLPKKVKCPWCPKKVTSERHLEEHMRHKHGKGKRPTLEQLEHERREAERAKVLAAKERGPKNGG